VYSVSVPLQTTLQAVAVLINVGALSFSICNIYLPPTLPIVDADLVRLISQLPTPFVLLSDFNAKHVVCGSDLNDDRGVLIHDLSSRFNLSLLNSGANTHFSHASGMSSALNLTFCRPGLSTHLQWSILCDLHGSDHFPVNVHIASSRLSEFRYPSCILKKADWMGFTQSVQIDNVDFPDVNSMMDHFKNAVVQTAAMNIPQPSIGSRRVPVPWWSDECRDAISARKRALKQFQIHPIQDNLVSFKCLRAAARRTIRSAKRRSWEPYVSSLSRSAPSDVV
jgi:hypothetical protein